nr:PREDICTED: uncharacterized protein LOC105674022 [Linepithema humile]XP_012225492.1 PREDICTED: uncharacterized protein LOC105674022 [Linepithema humile]
MQDKGYNVSGVKCSTKFQALKRTYKTILDHNSKSGNNPKKWKYFQNMQELFADKPWVQPLAVAGSHVTESEEEEENPPEKRIKKKKLNTLMEQYIADNKEEQKKRRENKEKHHNEKMVIFKRIENIMERLLEKRKD